MIPTIIGFDATPRTRIVFGLNSLRQLGELARWSGMQQPLIVTDPGIVAAGHVDRARKALTEAGYGTIETYATTRENPTTLDVDHCVDAARRARVDGFVGLGGGSSLDTAKACNLLLTNGGRMQDYRGYGKATKPLLPLVAVPTTAGTGSECQSYALIADEETHLKMACGDPGVAARVALLDPTLTVSQPAHVTACTGIDALAHALESGVSRARNEMSQLYSREAFRLIVHSLTRVMGEPENLGARSQVQLGAAYAGLAIENSMLGAAHSAANPLTAHFDIVHGQAVGMMLGHVIGFNSAEPAAEEGYRSLAVAAGLVESSATPESAVEAISARLEAILHAASLPSPIPSGQIIADLLPTLTSEAAEQWTARFNPREISRDDFASLYRAAFQLEL